MPADHVDKERARELAEKLNEFLDEHDRREHNGEACDGARVGIVGFLCHTIGVTGRDDFHVRFLARVAAEVEDYDRTHALNEREHETEPTP